MFFVLLPGPRFPVHPPEVPAVRVQIKENNAAAVSGSGQSRVQAVRGPRRGEKATTAGLARSLPQRAQVSLGPGAALCGGGL